MQRWEYMWVVQWRDKPPLRGKWTGFKATIDGVETDDPQAFGDYLDTFGEQGWELVNVVPVSYYWTEDWAGMTTHLFYFFKRPKT